MTDEEMRREIAEACPNIFRIAKESGDIIWMRGEHEQDCDPLNDLNAMHEAELFLKRNELPLYTEWMQSIQRRERDEYKWRYIWNATARQRVEAFLRTFGKWID